MLRMILSGGFSWGEAFAFILSSLFIIFFVLPIHEFAHGFIANKLGDSTARYQGRLTLNPLAHVDVVGALCTLFFGFGWAKAVPVNQRNLRRPKTDMALVALAGPVSNLLAALICLILLNVINIFAFTTSVMAVYKILSFLGLFFYFSTIINISIAVFNFIPIPPLDGSKILFSLLPDRIYYRLQMYEQYFFFILIIIMATGSFSGIISVLVDNIYRLLYFIASLPFGLF